MGERNHENKKDGGAWQRKTRSLSVPRRRGASLASDLPISGLFLIMRPWRTVPCGSLQGEPPSRRTDSGHRIAAPARKERIVKIAVVGTGYVGLVQGTCLAESGN